MRKLVAGTLIGLVWSLGAAIAQAEDLTLKLKNGLSVLGTVSLAEGKTLSGNPIVLFLHGTLAHKGMGIVSAQQALLNEREINVLAVNLSLGQDKREGMYECSTPHTHNHTDALDEIDIWLDWLKSQGVSDVTLMGHSRGGNQVAWHGVERVNPLVKNLVLVAPQTWTSEAHAASYLKRYNTPLMPTLTEMKKASDQDKPISPVDFIYCAKTSVTPAAFISYYADDERMNTPHLLTTIAKPTLVVAASDDAVVADLPAQMEKFSNENVSFSVVEEADHMFIDFAGEDLADQISEFLFAE